MTAVATRVGVRAKKCKCLAACQKKAREQGFQFVSKPCIDFKAGKVGMAGPFLMVEKCDGFPKRKPLPTVCCAFCPFCGKKQP